MKRIAIIMAGGSGERFWPLSRKSKPKQLLPLVSDKPMILESIERIASIIPPEDIYIITGALLLDAIRQVLPMLPPENVIAEPYKRNTAPCLALGAAFIAEKYSDQYKPEEISIAVLTADQSIYPNDAFTKTVEEAMSYVEKNPVLGTIGIIPNRPETGYGYIEVDDQFNIDSNEVEIKNVKQFREKPDLETAKEFVESGNYLWNSGMFFWRLDVFTEAMIKVLPEVGTKISEMRKCYQKWTDKVLPEPLHTVSPIFKAFRNVSIDYGLMERAEKVVVVKALFKWDDIGSWDSLERVKKTDENGNIIIGETALVNVNNSVIANYSTGKKIITAGVNLDGMVIVVTDDAVLVCPKDQVQDVKKAVAKVKEISK